MVIKTVMDFMLFLELDSNQLAIHALVVSKS